MKVWKYVFPKGSERVDFEIPENGRPIRVGFQGDLLCLWCLVDPSEPQRERRFGIYGTGQEIDASTSYVGSVTQGPFEWHIFEVF